jgi:aldehyde:ferredoxin oxidoreductase
MPNGRWGKLLFVDLSTGVIRSEDPPDSVYRSFLGGYGLAAHYLHERIPPKADPLGPQNILALMPGLLTGSGAQFSGRFMAATRSPLTGAWIDANCGGDFGPALRGAGWDGLFISGQAAGPVYLYIDEQTVEVHDATRLWGLNIRQTEHDLQEKHGKDVRIASIGPAGEKLSLISGIANDDGRLAARGGVGAVMGSKRLKAVVVRGRRRPPLADAHAFKAASSSYLKLFRRKPSSLSGRIPGLIAHLLPWFRRLRTQLSSGPAEMVIDTYRRYGTAAGTAILVELGDTPVRNWRGIGYRDFPLELSEGLSDQAVVRYLQRPYACHSCPVACGGIVEQPDGETAHRAEYETLASFGPLVMNADLSAVMTCNQICNQAGLDSISTGAAVAFALECAEKGWLPSELAGELPLRWGNSEVVVELTRRISARAPGLGHWLADGVRRAARRLPPEAQHAAVHAGGQELAMHRGLYEPGVAAGYALDPAPGRHTSTNAGNAGVAAFAPYFALLGRKPAGRYDFAEKGVTQAIGMCMYRAFDSLGLCQFALLMGRPPFLEWVNAATGWDMGEEELFRVGKRIQVLRHAFNARHGLPARFALPGRDRGDPPQEVGPLRGIRLDVEPMAESYFAFLGLDAQSGLPLPETARELGLEIRSQGVSG